MRNICWFVVCYFFFLTTQKSIQSHSSMKYNETDYYDIISLCEICFNIWIIIIDKSKITLIDSAFTLYVYIITVYDVYGFNSIEFIKRIFIEFFLQCLFKAITKLQFSFGSLGWMFFFLFSHSVKCYVEQKQTSMVHSHRFVYIVSFAIYSIPFRIHNTNRSNRISSIWQYTDNEIETTNKKQAASLDHYTVDTEYMHWMIIENFLNRFCSSNLTIENYFTHKISIKIDTY